jgi:hypothetical protein
MKTKCMVTPLDYVSIKETHFEIAQIRKNHVQSTKVKETRNRHGVTHRVPGGLGSQIFMTFGTRMW